MGSSGVLPVVTEKVNVFLNDLNRVEAVEEAFNAFIVYRYG